MVGTLKLKIKGGIVILQSIVSRLSHRETVKKLNVFQSFRLNPLSTDSETFMTAATIYFLPNKDQLLDVGDSGSKITGAGEPYESKTV